MDRRSVYLEAVRALICQARWTCTPSAPGTYVYLVDVHGLRVARDACTGIWRRLRGTELQYDVDVVTIAGSDDVLGLCGLYPDMTGAIQDMFSQDCNAGSIRVILNMNAYYNETLSYADAVRRCAWTRELVSDAIVLDVKPHS
jgi:hypothetical protein